jgi:hypothetical protein
MQKIIITQKRIISEINVILLLTVSFFILFGFPNPSFSQAFIQDSTGIDIYGDFRFRFEQDWNSETSTGNERDDRARARVRGRIGIKIRPNKAFEFEARLRSGNKNSQQSPHVTIADFSNNSTGKKDVIFDKYNFKLNRNNFWLWGGRNELPIWKQNELLWDDDATIMGGALGFRNFFLGKNGNLSFNTGYALLPDGMIEDSGEIEFAQFVYSRNINDATLFAAAGGLLAMQGEDNAVTNLLSGNDSRDYVIWIGNLQLNTKKSAIPLSLGFDFFYNSKSYSDSDLVGTPTGTDNDDTEGYVFQIRLGNLKKKGNWLIGYSFADIEALAVNASYAQDDWMRWGSATQTRASDFKGHEIRVGTVLPLKWKMLLRLYSVESKNNPEDGNRLRIDFNRKF